MSPLYKPLRQENFAQSSRATFDDSEAAQTVVLAPSTSVRRDVVAASDIDPRVKDRGAELAHRHAHRRAFITPPRLCSRIPYGSVATRAGIVLTEDRRWIVESVGPSVGEVVKLRALRRISVEMPRHFVDEDVAVVYSIVSPKKIGNYYHWVVEGLARAAMLQPAGVPNSVKLLIPEPILDVHRDCLAAIGIEEARILGWTGAPTRFRNVYLPSGPQHLGDTPAASAISYLRDHAARFRRASPTRRLWVSRLAARRRRRMAGEPELIALAAEHGFEEVVAEHLTALEQIELFAQAEVIAGLHGAGLANAVFMAPRTAVIEAASETLKPRQKPLFWNLAAAGSQAYAYCVGPKEGLDPRRFERVLSEMLA
jgi:hypothetical protein